VRTRVYGRTARVERTCAPVAHDLGRMLGCGAHLDQLRRTASGEFEIEQARTIAQLESLAADDRLVDAIVPAAKDAAGLPERLRGRVDGRADSQWPKLSGFAIPFATGFAARQGGHAGGRTGGYRRGGIAEPVSSRGGAVTPGSLLR